MARATNAQLIAIDDHRDPRLEHYRDVRDRDLRGRGHRFLGEQALVVEKMLAIPGVTESVLLSPNHVERIAPLAPPEVPLYVAPIEVLQQVTGFPFHRGVLAIGFREPFENRGVDEIVPAAPAACTILVLEDLRNMDNMGTLFRNAAAFGVDAVVLSPRCHDPLYRKCVRVSIGHVLRTPWARSRDWPADLERLGRAHGVTVIGAALDPRAKPLDEIERPDRVALLVGEEYAGLSREALDRCDALARIPLAPEVDSLNVAVAAAICLHRFTRAERR